MYFWLMAAIFYLLITTTSESTHTSPAVLLNPGNVGVAVRILLMTSIQDLQSKIQVFPVSHMPFLFPVQHSSNFTWCDTVSSSSDVGLLKISEAIR